MNKCTVKKMFEVIVNQSPIAEKDFLPEHELFFAVINQTLKDLLSKNGQERRSAINYFNGRIFENHAGMLEIDPEAVIYTMKQGGFTLDE